MPKLSSLFLAVAPGLLLPFLAEAVGLTLPDSQRRALAVVGWSLGLLAIGLYDILTHDDRAENESNRRQRDANSAMTEARAAEVWAKLNPAPEPVLADDHSEIERAWRLAFHRFIGAGNRYGFKVRDLGAGPHKVVEWEDWSKLREPLVDIGVLEARGGTRWAGGWNYDRWQKEGATIPLPFFKDMPPPVAIVGNAAQTQPKQQVLVDEEGVRA